MDFRIRREDLPLIRLPLALFGAALLLALALVLLAVWQQGKAERRQQQAQQRLQQVQAEAVSMQQDRQDYERYSGPFRELRARGIVGDEDRLQWVELLTGLRREHPQMQLKYRLEPQRPADFIADAPQGMRVMASRMHLSFLAAHEGQLLMLLQTLDKDARGLHLLRQCRIQRSKLEQGQTDWVAPPLESRCVIEWLTVRQLATAPAEGAGAAEGAK
ncbi:MAG: hypothetical protein U1F63_12790 [Chitinivorax sp.]